MYRSTKPTPPMCRVCRTQICDEGIRNSVCGTASKTTLLSCAGDLGCTCTWACLQHTRSRSHKRRWTDRHFHTPPPLVRRPSVPECPASAFIINVRTRQSQHVLQVENAFNSMCPRLANPCVWMILMAVFESQRSVCVCNGFGSAA